LHIAYGKNGNVIMHMKLYLMLFITSAVILETQQYRFSVLTKL